MNNEVILEMNNISKSFPGVKALDNVSLKVKKGSVHALMGENGAGKSTLMKILMGNFSYDKGGEILFFGKKLDTHSIDSVLQQGIVMIYQELNAVDNMLAMENVFIGREPYKVKGVLLDKKKIYNDTVELFKELEINNIKPRDRVSKLSVAKKQMLEIAKAVSYNAKLIVMDEPTSAITEKECLHLFNIVNRLKAKGISFIFITHKMDEVFKIADEVTVLRDGKYIATKKESEIDTDQLITMLVGRELKEMFPKTTVEIGEPVFEVKNLTVEGVFKDVSFELKRGEILGVAGLMGAGRTEVMETITGYRAPTTGEIYLNGKKINIKKPKDAIKYKIAMLTEDRKKTGLFLPLSVLDNIMILSLDKCANGIHLSKKKLKKCASDEIVKYKVKTPSPEQKISNLSGGNQQKALISRWLLSDPDIIILDEPTRGIDVGAKSEIHALMGDLVKAGKSVIMISSEMPEVIGMSDRIMVMNEGVVTGFLDREEVTQEKVMELAMDVSQ